MKRIIIGTAGHIDHGKTTLVKALTGVDTDRLKEEQQRGITIELGFAPFQLPGGQKAAIIDMPGHERFIKHMLAGAFGVDLVLFTVAADEGIMPQSREHMDIIELLGVEKGVVVLTKTDLVDEEWQMLVEEEVREFIDGTILRGAPIVPVSALKKEGLDQVIAWVEKIAEEVEEKPAFGHMRLPVDRVFTVAGFGTVVTGTLWSGQIQVGDQLELMPLQKPVRVRNIQVHNDRVTKAYAGQRVAVNIQGVDLADIKRGYLLATPGFLTPTFRIDTKLRLLSSSPRTLKNWNRVRFHLGTDECLGRVVLLDRDELLPGEEAFAQLVMEKPVVAYKGDPFVIRYYSPVTTIGGGIVIDGNAPKQKRFREDVLEQLAVKEEGSLYDHVLQELETKKENPVLLEELIKKIGAGEEEVMAELQQLQQDEKAILLGATPATYISCQGVDQVYGKIQVTLDAFHRKNPLRPGYSKEDLRSRLFPRLAAKDFNNLLKHLEKNGRLEGRGNFLRLSGFTPSLTPLQEEAREQIRNTLVREGFVPPSPETLREETGMGEKDFQELFTYMLEQGDVVKVTEGIFFAREVIGQGKEMMRQFFAAQPEMTLAEARDLFNTTRKFALPLVEYYDRIRFTRRIGDGRVLLPEK